jgi:hypothetical protein
MSTDALIAALDGALVGAEEVILRRVVGTAPNQINIDVTCVARIDAASVEQIAAGIPATDFNLIMSPTQINLAQWPGGSVPALPPFDLDQKIPRAGPTDKVLMRGQPPKAVVRVDPKFFDGEVVRIDMRVTG